MTIYLDVLFLTNMLINTIIIFYTGAITNSGTKLSATLAGGAVSALYSVIAFFPHTEILYTLVGRISFSVLFVMIFFKCRRISALLYKMAVFFTVSLIVCGTACALMFWSRVQSTISNGVLYFDITLPQLMVSCGIAVAFIKIFIKVSDRMLGRKSIISDIKITVRGREFSEKILLDTGCELKEPLSGKPVILVCGEPGFKTGRLIKLTGVGGTEYAALFKPDKIINRSNNNLDIQDVYIGFVNHRFSNDGLYTGVAPPDAFKKTEKSEGGIFMLKKIRELCTRLYIKLSELKEGRTYYIGGSDTLPPPLPPEEEVYWTNRLSDANYSAQARKLLIERNLRLVVYIAKRFDSSGVGIEDLISIGSIGLIKAINTFKPEKKIKLATYASRCIENEILMYLRKNSGNKAEVSIDEPLNVDWDGNELLLSDILGTDEDVTPKKIEDETDKELLRLALSRLSRRERDIVKLRFGIDKNGREMTQKEVADLLGISQSYISRLEKRIIKRLRTDINRMINN